MASVINGGDIVNGGAGVFKGGDIVNGGDVHHLSQARLKSLQEES